MEISTLKPEERIFHVDKECYLFYLGSDKDDDRPFARIGNSKKLTDVIIKNTSSIIITDSITGDPLLEPMNINPDKMGAVRYVGDKKTVQNYLNFIHNYNIRNGHISSLEDIKQSHDMAEVLFFKDGNIRLLYNQKLLFDLKRAEREDLHFNENANRLKGTLGTNTLRYSPEDFSSPGFVVEGGSFLLFQKQKIAAFGLPERYFETLISRGIDPDWIETVIADSVTDSLIQLLKRKQATGKKIRIITGNTSVMRSAVQLFRGDQHTPVNAEIEEFLPDSKKKFLSFGIEKKQTGHRVSGYRISHPLIPFELFLAREKTRHSGKEITIDPANRVLVVPIESPLKGTVNLTDGVPYIFSGKLRLADEELVERCFTDLIPLCENVQDSEHTGRPGLEPGESTLLTMFSRLFDDITGERFSRTTAYNLYRHFKKIKPRHGSSLTYLLFNISGITRQLASAETAGHAMKDILIKIADRAFTGSQKGSMHLPLIGELYTADGGLQFYYRASKHPISRDDCIMFQDSITDIQNQWQENQKSYTVEMERLNALLKELESGVSKKVSAGRIPESGIATAPGVAAGKTSVSVSGLGIPAGLRKKGKRRKATASVTPSQEAEAKVSVSGLGIPAGRRTDKDETKRGRNLKIFIPAAAVVIAAVIIAALLFIPGTRFGEKMRGGVAGEKQAAEGVESQTAETSAEISEGKEAAQNQKEGVFTISVGDESSPYRIEVPITILDIYYLTNSIAVKNGYRKLDSPKRAGRDPDWIYPGNPFVLPDETRYTVAKGDTMWDMAHRFIKKTLEADWPTYVRISEEIDAPDTRTHDRETLKRELESLKQRSYSENFSREIDKKITKLLGEQ